MVGALLRTLISRLLLLFLLVLFLPFLFVAMLMPAKMRRNNAFVARLVCLFYWLALKISFFPVTYTYQDSAAEINEPVIFVANHQSSFDIPLLGLLSCKTPHLWIARDDLRESLLLRIPLWLFTETINVNERIKGARELVRIIEIAKNERINIMIFPEGGRFSDGVVHQFFSGFALIAQKTGRPVVPVCIFDIEKVYHRESFLVHRYPVRVVVGPVFRILQEESAQGFTQRVFQWFTEQQSECNRRA